MSCFVAFDMKLEWEGPYSRASLRSRSASSVIADLKAICTPGGYLGLFVQMLPIRRPRSLTRSWCRALPLV